jgi:hypothetical protein
MIKNYTQYIKETKMHGKKIKAVKSLNAEEIKKLSKNGTLMDVLNKDFVGFIEFRPTLNDYLMVVTKYNMSAGITDNGDPDGLSYLIKRIKFSYTSYYPSDGTYSRSSGQCGIESVNHITKYEIIEPTRIYSDIDPYGEEDWEEEF